MQFLQHPKRNTLPKPLSKSRLRERRRESRELEEVSAFFLPPKTQNNGGKSGKRHRVDSTQPRSSQMNHNDQSDSITYGEPSVPSYYVHEEASEKPLRSSEPCRLVSTTRTSLGGSQAETEPSKPTTYFTWSSSRASPVVRESVDTRPRSSSSASEWTTTPTSVRRALIDTGVYRDTGIHPYDESSTNKGRKNPEIGGSDYHGESHESQQQKPCPQARVSYCDQAVMTDDRQSVTGNVPHKRGNIFTTSDTARKDGESQAPQDAYSYRHSLSPGGLDCNKYPETPRTPIHRDPRPSNPESMEADQTAAPNSVGRISQTSRDIMPPPPLPLHKNSTSVHNLSSHNAFQNVNEEQIDGKAGGAHSHKSSMESQQGLPVSEVSGSVSIQSSKPVTEAEKTLDPINAASWIPQVNTPSGSRVQRERNLSRIAMRSPIYQSQLDGQSYNDVIYKEKQSQVSQDSMAEFIAMIEREIQMQPSLHDNGSDRLSPGMHDDRTVTSGQAVEYGYEPYSSYKDDLRDEAEVEHEPILARSMDQHIVRSDQLDSGIARIREVDNGVGDECEEERQEMSRFWKPNKFSQF